MPELLSPLLCALRQLKEQQDAAAASVVGAGFSAGKPPLPPAPAAATTTSGRKVTLNPRFSPTDMPLSLRTGAADSGAAAADGGASSSSAAAAAAGGDDPRLLGRGSGGRFGLGNKLGGKKRARASTVLSESVREAFIKYMRTNSSMGEQSAHMFAGAANALVSRVLGEVNRDRAAAAAETKLDMAALQQIVCRHFDVFERHTLNAYANLSRIWKMLHGFVAHFAAMAREQGLPIAALVAEGGGSVGGGGGGGSLADGESESESGSDFHDGDALDGGKARAGTRGSRRLKRKKGKGPKAGDQQRRPKVEVEERVVAHEEEDDDDYDLRGIIFGLPPKPKPRYYGGGGGGGSRRKRGGGGGAGAYGYGGFPGGLSALLHDGGGGGGGGGFNGRKPQNPTVLAQEVRMGFIGWMATNTANRGPSILTILRAVNNFLARTLPRCPGGEACLETLLPLSELRALVERHETMLVQEVVRGTNSSLRTFWRHFANFLRDSQGEGLDVFVSAAESIENGDLAGLPASGIAASASALASAASAPFILPLSASYDPVELVSAARAPPASNGGGGGGGAGAGGNGTGSLDAVSSSANSVASTASMGGGAAAGGLGPAPSGSRVAYFDVGGAFYQAGGRRRHKKGSGAYAAMLDTGRHVKQMRQGADADADAEAEAEAEVEAAEAEAQAEAEAEMAAPAMEGQGQQLQQEMAGRAPAAAASAASAGAAAGGAKTEPADEEELMGMEYGMEMMEPPPLASPRGRLTAAGMKRSPSPYDEAGELGGQRSVLAASKRLFSNVLDDAARDGFLTWMQDNTKMQPVSMVTAQRTASRVLATMLTQIRGLPAASREYSLDEIRAFVQENEAAFLHEVARTSNVSVKTFWRHFLKYCMGEEAVRAFNRDLFKYNGKGAVGVTPGMFDAYAAHMQQHHPQSPHHHQQQYQQQSPQQQQQAAAAQAEAAAVTAAAAAAASAAAAPPVPPASSGFSGLSPALLARFQKYLQQTYECEETLTPLVAQEVADRTRELAERVGERETPLAQPAQIVAFYDRHQAHPLVAQDLHTFKRFYDFCRGAIVG